MQLILLIVNLQSILLISYLEKSSSLINANGEIVNCKIMDLLPIARWTLSNIVSMNWLKHLQGSLDFPPIIINLKSYANVGATSIIFVNKWISAPNKNSCMKMNSVFKAKCSKNMNSNKAYWLNKTFILMLLRVMTT